MSGRWPKLAARLIRATLAADKAYLFFDRLRARVVPRLAGDEVMDAYNDLAYGRTDAYRADAATFRRGWFGWEEQAVRRFFPPPPARVVVGGAGGGREAFALAEMGYEVVAFEPSERLARSMQRAIPSGMHVRAFRAGYENLPALNSLDPSQADESLVRLGPFDAAILGWASFSHIRTERARVATLELLAPIVRGPMLVSAFPIFPTQSAASGQAAPMFAVHIGVYQPMTADHLSATARTAGFRVLHADGGQRHGDWLHAVIAPDGVAVSDRSAQRAEDEKR